MKDYPANITETIPGLAMALRFICRLRGDDIREFKNLSQTFISGRRVAKVPSSSTASADDRLGDFNVTSSYAYFCVDNGSGTAVWRRVAVSSW